MSIIKAFRAVRPAPQHVEAIAALPYDVYSLEEARNEVKDKPLSFLKIDRSETFFNADVDSHSEQVYKRASEELYKMIERKEFIQEDKKALYLYQLTMDGRSQIGVVGCTSVDEYLSGHIKKHENTRADKELDRIKHVDYCNANTGPIFLTYKSKDTINTLITHWITKHEALYDFVADDQVGHKIWKIDDENVLEKLIDLFSKVNALYIADGHHRAASAVKVANMRREANKEYSGNEAFNYFLSVSFPDEQLYIMDYNRVVKDLNGLSKNDFIDKVKEKFVVISTSKKATKPYEKGTFSIYIEGDWYLIKANEGTYDEEDPVLSLDVAILQQNILEPILGIGDIRIDKRIDFVGGIRGLIELEKRANSDMKIGFALYPTSINELMVIADAGELMPPKSTWFEPKLRSGLFIHLLK